MEKRLVTVNVEDKNLTKSTASKKVKSEKSLSQNEAEKFGIVEINNAQAKSKLKNSNDIGYEKHTLSNQKKGVKATISKVDDYFDFSFRPAAKQVKNETKPVQNKNTVEVLKDDSTAKTTVLRAETLQERSSNVTAEASERIIDDAAARIISIARIGALFDCEICQKIN